MKRKRKEAQEKDNIEKRAQEEGERQRAEEDEERQWVEEEAERQRAQKEAERQRAQEEESEHNGAESTGYTRNAVSAQSLICGNNDNPERVEDAEEERVEERGKSRRL